jgi:choline dehydrogenase
VVVVGGGSAGCVLASRLAASGSRTVLLLEAGPDLRSQPPTGMHDGWRTYRERDWGLESEPDERGEVEPLYRGKVVGGSSWMTRFVVRGSPADYAAWAGLGNAGWHFEGVLDAFCRLETDLDFAADPWHGDSGPISVTRYPEVVQSSFEDALVDSCTAVGIPLIEDHNRPRAEGLARMPRNARAGRRAVSADTYLGNPSTLGNLTIWPQTVVGAVLLDGHEAVGVCLADDTVVEAGQVVLCAGTYASPVILMRSGIGPPDHLREHGIEVRVPLRGVGSNLADHQGFDVAVGYRGQPGLAPRFFWLATARSSTAGAAEPPDIGLWVPEPFSAGDEPAGTDVTAVLLTPASRGSVRLRSPNPTALPLIRLPGLREPHDVRRLAEAATLAGMVAEHPSIRALCTAPASPLPLDPRELRSLVAREAWSYPHVVGTCAMGPSPDSGAVVDPRGTVHGVARLSVVDASVIPIAPSGFPHVITLMVAERIAAILDTAA